MRLVMRPGSAQKSSSDTALTPPKAMPRFRACRRTPSESRDGAPAACNCVAGADDEGVEAVEILKRVLERPLQGVALAHTPGEIPGGDLAVVLGLEPLAPRL
jgi:hypothetical protein